MQDDRMTEKEARETVDAEVVSLISNGFRTAGELTEELQTSKAAKVLVTHLRPLSRVVDQALQRLRRAEKIKFIADKREWVLR